MILRFIKNRLTQSTQNGAQELQNLSTQQSCGVDQVIDLDKPLDLDSTSTFSSFDNEGLFK